MSADLQEVLALGIALLCALFLLGGGLRAWRRFRARAAGETGGCGGSCGGGCAGGGRGSKAGA